MSWGCQEYEVVMATRDWLADVVGVLCTHTSTMTRLARHFEVFVNIKQLSHSMWPHSYRTSCQHRLHSLSFG